MNKTTSQNGFTLIELIIVMVILGIMAAVAVPRYLDSIENAEESAEKAVIASIRAGLRQAANDSLYTHGRASWPTNPFDVLVEKPAKYSATDNGTEAAGPELDGVADSDDEWTFDYENSRITHQRADNSRHYWSYNKGTQNMTNANNAGIGSLGEREDL